VLAVEAAGPGADGATVITWGLGAAAATCRGWSPLFPITTPTITASSTTTRPTSAVPACSGVLHNDMNEVVRSVVDSGTGRGEPAASEIGTLGLVLRAPQLMQ
jgi:hypothetical protein